jgi:ubiquitin-conjugating enzyme E2 Q
LKTYAKSHDGQDYVKLEMKFLPEYPYRPPFIRVITPRFAFHTGRVTVGGSICFELLTGSGWSSVISLESIFLQIKFEMNNGKPRVDFGNDSAYSESEAKQAFFRVAGDHGWDVNGLK